MTNIGLIPLTQGKVAIVNAEDVQRVLEYKTWNAARRKWKSREVWYASHCEYKGPTTLMHRLILNAKPGQDVDHKNGDGLDNRRNNLRLCTRSQNNQHKISTWSKSGFLGVHHQSNTKKWRAKIKFIGRQIHIGYFDTKEEASLAYQYLARLFFGEFASDIPIEGRASLTPKQQAKLDDIWRNVVVEKRRE